MTVFYIQYRIRKQIGFFPIFFIICSLIGCASNPKVIKMDRPAPVAQDVRIPPSPAPGSIWPGEMAASSLFTDKKAMYVNDIVTIVIDESSRGGNSADTKTSKDTKTFAGISSFLGVEKYIARRNKDLTDGDIFSGGTEPSIYIEGSSKSSLAGKGATSRDGTLKARITARVIEVLDNRNLVIEGRRQLMVNAEDQYIVITGIIRPEDITSNNMISSQYIADARIVYTGNGVINDKMRPGWLTRMIDRTWPF
jgi:flagellar L-ring protein precursor FlgH